MPQSLVPGRVGLSNANTPTMFVLTLIARQLLFRSSAILHGCLVIKVRLSIFVKLLHFPFLQLTTITNLQFFWAVYFWL